MMRLLTAQQMKQAEAQAVEQGTSYLTLMQRAGSQAAEQIRRRYGGRGRSFCFLCGRGNNGGDGFVAARVLCAAGEQCAIVLVFGLPTTDNARDMLAKAKAEGIPVVEMTEQVVPDALVQADVAVDALFGTGFHGSLPQKGALLATYCRDHEIPVCSLDIASGVCADTGEVEAEAFQAELTVTFHSQKPGHVIYPGTEKNGQVEICDIGISDNGTGPTQLQTINPTAVLRSLPVRLPNSNKGTYGRALCLCGSYGMAGAAVLAAKACARSGTGLVEVAAPQAIYTPLAAQLTEQVITPLPETDHHLAAGTDRLLVSRIEAASACLFGCGSSTGAAALETLSLLLSHARCPIVLDADGINLLAKHIYLLKTAKAPIVLTPHPGEMARLIASSPAQVQAHRLRTATEFAATYPVVLVLKGANTLVACGQEVLVNQTGDSGLAKAGSGDVLAGMTVGLLAQGMKPFEAAAVAVCLHGLAGERASRRSSMRGVQPSDVLQELPLLF